MCGIVAISGKNHAVDEAISGLLTIQGRGSQASGLGGIVNGRIRVVKQKGEATNLKQLAHLRLGTATTVLGHIRYGTAGADLVKNAHPFVSKNHRIALAHNGEIENATELRRDLIRQGVSFKSDSDSEVALRMIENASGNGIVAKVLSVLSQIDKSYSLVVLYDGYLIGACDRHGMHPLCLGKFKENGGGHVFASEDVAIRTIGAEPIKYLKQGQVVVVSPEQEVSTYWLDNIPATSHHCSFNFAYTARPDSKIWERSVSKVRKAMGLAMFDQLTENNCLPMVDIICPVLDSGRTSTLMFAKAYSHHRLLERIHRDGVKALEKIDLEELFMLDFGVNRGHHTRNFQLETQALRDHHILLKHGVDPAVVKGKRILLGDDSIVRSTTSRKIVAMLRQAGAIEVHLISFSPPIVKPCLFGGTETKDENLLIAAKHQLSEIAELIGADSVHYPELERYMAIVNANSSGHCFACHGCPFN